MFFDTSVRINLLKNRINLLEKTNPTQNRKLISALIREVRTLEVKQ